MLGHLRIKEIRLAPGQEWERQTAVWWFVRLGSGPAYCLGPGRPQALNEGELIIFPPGVRGVLRASQLGEAAFHGFGFAPELLRGLLTLSEREHLKRLGSRRKDPVQILPSTHPTARCFGELLAQRRSGTDRSERVALLSVALTLFGERMACPRPPSLPGPDSAARDRFRQIVAPMPEAELIQRTPAQLARLCGCSNRHFGRVFKEYFAQSPRAHLTALRLLKARQLLGQTDWALDRVAHESGYRSLGLFTTLFKKRFGAGPAEWRRAECVKRET